MQSLGLPLTKTQSQGKQVVRQSCGRHTIQDHRQWADLKLEAAVEYHPIRRTQQAASAQRLDARPKGRRKIRCAMDHLNIDIKQNEWSSTLLTWSRLQLMQLPATRRGKGPANDRARHTLRRGASPHSQMHPQEGRNTGDPSQGRGTSCVSANMH